MGAKKFPNPFKTNLDHKEVLKRGKVGSNVDTKNPYNTNIVIDKQTSEKYIKLGKKILNKKENQIKIFRKNFQNRQEYFVGYYLQNPFLYFQQ